MRVPVRCAIFAACINDLVGCRSLQPYTATPPCRPTYLVGVRDKSELNRFGVQFELEGADLAKRLRLECGLFILSNLHTAPHLHKS